MPPSLNSKKLFLGIPIIASILLWSYFLKASGFSLLEFLTIADLSQALQVLLSFNFILFVLLFPMTYAIIFSMASFIEKKELRIIATASSILGLIAAMFLFLGTGMIIIGAFYVIGLILAIETAYIKLEELKKFVIPRMNSDAGRTALLLVGIGVFAFTALSVLPEQEKYLNETEKSLAKLVSDESLGTGLSESLADIYIQTQKQQLEELTSSSQYTDLKTVSDPKAQNLVLYMETIKQQISSPAYKEQVKTQIIQSQGKLSQEQNVEQVFERVRKSLPFYSFVEEYFWLIAAFILTSFYFLIANTIVLWLAIIYGTIFHQIFSHAFKSTLAGS